MALCAQIAFLSADFRPCHESMDVLHFFIVVTTPMMIFFVCMLTSTRIQRIALRLALIQKETRRLSVSNEFDRTIRNKFLRKNGLFDFVHFIFKFFSSSIIIFMKMYMYFKHQDLNELICAELYQYFHAKKRSFIPICYKHSRFLKMTSFER